MLDVNLRLRRTRLLGSAATGMALVFGGMNVAYAQTVAAPAAEEEVAEDEEATLDTIEVTGIRGGLQNSINLKKNETSIVEAISAEDIGKLPDVSVAESLARLPGLAIQRTDGRGQQLSIRGLGPDFTTALLNGREQVTVGDNRGVEFDQYPSELLSGVVVYKSPDAGLLGQGLMGTVDLRTIRPLSQSDQVLAFNARYEQNSLGELNAGSDADGYRLSGMYIDQFANDTIGVALGFATISSPSQVERYRAWGYPNFNGSSPEVTGSTPLAGNPLLIGGADVRVQSNTIERNSVIGTFEYEPSEAFRVSVDAFFSDFQEDQILRGMELPLAWGYNGYWNGDAQRAAFPGVGLNNGVVSDGLLQSGSFTNVKPVLRGDNFVRNAELLSLGFNTEFDIAAGWRGTVDLSHSSNKREDFLLETIGGTGYREFGALDTIGFRMGGDGDLPRLTNTINYADFNVIQLADSQGWGGQTASRPFGQAGYLKIPEIEDSLNSLRLEANKEVNFGPFTDLEVGLNIAQREKTKDTFERYLVIANGGMSASVPAAFRLSPTSLGFVGLGNVAAWDVRGMYNLTGANRVYDLTQNLSGPNESRDIINKRWQVNEDVTTAYVQLDIDAVMGTVPVTGNLGLQYNLTETESIGTVFIGDNPTEGRYTHEYDNWLPSLNLSAEIMDSTYLRFAAARTLARPRLDELAANQSISRNPSNPTPTNPYFTGGGGNPQLEAVVANGVDVALERYFAGSGYVSVALFYKELESWIRGRRLPFDFSDFMTDAERAAGVNPIGFLDGPQNLDGGYIQGLEFATSIPGSVVSEALDGFGVIFSASFNESEITPDGTPIQVPGLSEQILNATLFYEKNGFQARISNRYRDDFLGEITIFDGNRDTRQIRGESVVDAQIGYNFQDGPLSGMSLLFQANNLGNEPYRTYANGDTRLGIDHHTYGTNFLFGVSWKR